MTSFTPFSPATLLAGRYEIRKEIGRGGMSAIYEVLDRRLQTRRALKQIVRTENVLRSAFEREAQLLAHLDHPALPKVQDYFSEGELSFIVMDLIEGDDLHELLSRQGAVPLEQVLRWGDQLLDVLTYLHTH